MEIPRLVLSSARASPLCRRASSFLCPRLSPLSEELSPADAIEKRIDRCTAAGSGRDGLITRMMMFKSTYGRSSLPRHEVVLHPKYIRARYGRFIGCIYRGSLIFLPESLPSARGLAPYAARDFFLRPRKPLMPRWMNDPLINIRLFTLSPVRGPSPPLDG